ncbi:hypothetical protein QYF36_024642 [Acer negundo]|nr:hypothetical protein QYF36_024642 [Acer negundo]
MMLLLVVLGLLFEIRQRRWCWLSQRSYMGVILRQLESRAALEMGFGCGCGGAAVVLGPWVWLQVCVSLLHGAFGLDLAAEVVEVVVVNDGAIAPSPSLASRRSDLHYRLADPCVGVTLIQKKRVGDAEEQINVSRVKRRSRSSALEVVRVYPQNAIGFQVSIFPGDDVLEVFDVKQIRMVTRSGLFY